jgi:hypothetical protein
MKVVILYHPKSEHGGRVEDYAHEYERLHEGRKLQLISLESKDGWETAKLYDVTSYPAVLAIADDGQLQKMWQAEQLPLSSELDAYFQN